MGRSHKKKNKEPDSDESDSDNKHVSRKSKSKHKKRYKKTSSSSSSIDSEEIKKQKKSSRKRYRSESSNSNSSFEEKIRRRKHKHRQSSSENNSEDEKERTSAKEESDSDEWTEKVLPAAAKKNESITKRDDWMSFESFTPTVQRERKEKQKKEKNTAIIAAPGQTDRELNPYWKNGGTGLPTEEKDLGVSSHAVGDKGLEWYQKAFLRAQETAKEEKRPLEEVVSERWGSMETLKSLIMAAESKRRERSHHRRRESPSDRHRHKDRKRDRNDDFDKKRNSYREEPRFVDNKDEGSSRPKFQKPGSEYERKRESIGDGERKWMKASAREELKAASSSRGMELMNRVDNSEQTKEEDQKKEELLDDDQINALAAKVVKAEIMGNSSLVEKLKTKLEQARKAREEQKLKQGSSKEETVILMHTNEKGLTRPVQGPSLKEPSRGRRKNHNVTTHADGQRVRYFADDDQRDIKEMFEREKLGTMDDEKEMFLKLAAKSRLGDHSDEEEAFMDIARVKVSEGKIQEKERQKAIDEERRRRKTFEGCSWCLDNKARLKHLVVAIGETSYLCLPAEESLTPFHCLIVPIQHSACGTLVDEDVWEEMHKFRKAVTRMAQEQEQDVVFFEQAVKLRSNPHMVLNCIFLDKEMGDMAPIYFKKAILDSESEWANNKKVVDIKGPDIRRSVPKGLPYFSIEFTPSGGFAHVIEDEKMFPNNFAQEIIGGMLDLDHRTWRKPKHSNFAAQREKTLSFSKVWKKFDFTKKKKSSSSSSSSKSSSSDSD